MRKSFGKSPLVYPQPVLVVATYNEDGTTDAMTAAWGGIGDDTQIFLCLDPTHKTVENIRRRKAFTVAITDEAHIKEADYLGLVSANDHPKKFEETGLKSEKSEYVDAPVLVDFPITMECELISYESEHCHCFGEIINTSAKEEVLTEGKVDYKKLKPVVYEPSQHNYVSLGEVVAKAFSCGLEIQK
ncbi:MAG: flavin reductase family protein [Spirochaetales bacterium]|nr:flavin reductase family protein [Candidatus Physcosoma equi]